MLKYSEFINMILNEASAYRNPGVTYEISKPLKVPKELHKFKFNRCDDVTLNSGKLFYYAKDSSMVRQISKEESLNYLKNVKNTVALKAIEDESYILIATGDINNFREYKDKFNTSTDTDIKEGLVIYFYLSNINNKPEFSNFDVIIKELSSIDATNSLDKTTINKITEWLNKLTKTKGIIDTLTDFWSTSQVIKNNIGLNAYLTRISEFNDIRKLGSRITNLPPDKWNPGDIYAIDKGKLQDVNDHIKSINPNNPDAIGQLNLLFSDSFAFETNENRAEGAIISISLKQEQAQGGKAKQFLKVLSQSESEYNLTKDEITLFDNDKEELRNRIFKLREDISNSCLKSKTTIILRQDKDIYSKDESLLKKYASVKLAHFLLKDPEKMDENILRATGFGMSLTEVNPTFFKCIGSTKGIAKIDKFSAGQTITLLYDGLKSKESEITIIDLNSNAEIQFLFKIKKGEDHKFIKLKCKPNGNTQATLEIEKITQI